MFRVSKGDETIPGRDETIFRPPRRPAETAGTYNATIDEAGPKSQGNQQGTVMIKALSAIAIAAFIAAALTVLPGFAPEVEAGVPVALAKGDRLDIRTVGRRLLAAILAQFRAVLPAQCRFQDNADDRGSCGQHRSPLIILGLAAHLRIGISETDFRTSRLPRRPPRKTTKNRSCARERFFTS